MSAACDSGGASVASSGELSLILGSQDLSRGGATTILLLLSSSGGGITVGLIAGGWVGRAAERHEGRTASQNSTSRAEEEGLVIEESEEGGSRGRPMEDGDKGGKEGAARTAALMALRRILRERET